MSQQTRQNLNSLPYANRKQVERIVMRHASQHHDSGILPAELEPVYSDVIEAVKLQVSFPVHHVPTVKTVEEAQQLTRYFAVMI